MANVDRTIKKVLYKNTRYILEFFMYEPKVDKYKENYSITINPILTLRQLNSASYTEDFSTMQDRSYRITPRNLYRVLKFFNTIVKWFYDENKKDLFLINEENDLIFNSDYNNLYTMTAKTLNENTVMKAIPTVVMFNDKRYEGIHLYINKSTNIIIMTKEETEMILGFLKDFSFNNEIIECLTSIDYATRNNLIQDNTGGFNNNKNGNYVKSPFDK